jgi:hypothetical protein
MPPVPMADEPLPGPDPDQVERSAQPRRMEPAPGWAGPERVLSAPALIQGMSFRQIAKGHRISTANVQRVFRKEPTQAA